MNTDDILLLAIAKSTRPGPVEPPNSVLAVVEAKSDPLNSISSWDASNELFHAIRSQFGFVELVRRGTPLSGEEFDKFAGLLRWVIREGADWTASADPSFTKLVALFVVGQFVTTEANFWCNVPDDFMPSDGLLAALEGMIAGIRTSFTTRGLVAPIWELEAVDEFEKADVKNDWIGIARGWRMIEGGLSPSMAIVQATHCLNRFAPERLVKAVSCLRQTGSVISIVQSLTPNAALRLGASSNNHHVQFAATFISASLRSNRQPFSDSSKISLVNILESVSKDSPRWAAWMHVFNLFPSRFPELQTPLGCALVNASDIALQAYVDAISLRCSGQGTRSSIADCLRAFRERASVSQRKALWNLAYKRWSLWRFGLNGASESLNNISRCELDYAVAGYVVECLDKDQRQQMIASLIEKLKTVEDNWHVETTGCLSEWNAVLSELQPLLLATSIEGTAADWVDETPTMRLPFDPDKEVYLTLKYGRPQMH